MNCTSNIKNQDKLYELIQLQVNIGSFPINVYTLQNKEQIQIVLNENTIIAYFESINIKIPFEKMYKDILQEQKVNFPSLVILLVTSEMYKVIPIETLYKLFKKISHYMNFYAKISLIDTKIKNIPWFETTNEYKQYLQREMFDISTIIKEDNSSELEKLISFVNWNIKKQHNFMFLYLQKAIIELENKYLNNDKLYLNDKMILEKESNLTKYEKELIKTYLATIPNDVKKTKKGIAVNFRYIINLILDDTAVFTINLKSYLYENKLVYNQFIRYIKEISLYLRFINLIYKQDLNLLNDTLEDKYFLIFAEESINKGLLSKTLISKLFNLFSFGNELIHKLFIANISNIYLIDDPK